MKRIILQALLITGFLAFTASAARSASTPTAESNKDKALMKIDEMIQKAKIDTAKSDWRTSLQKPSEVAFDPSRKYFVRMATNKGTMRIRLMPETAPMHVTSFLYLTKLGFYDGLSFHRVIQGFMAQGGCPLGTGKGGPGYKYAGEFNASAKHDRKGILSTANAGPGTDGSQFFITFAPTPWLDGKHTVFGSVVDGLDTLDKIEAVGSKSGQTTEPLKIEKMTAEVE